MEINWSKLQVTICYEHNAAMLMAGCYADVAAGCPPLSDSVLLPFRTLLAHSFAMRFRRPKKKGERPKLRCSSACVYCACYSLTIIVQTELEQHPYCQQLSLYGQVPFGRLFGKGATVIAYCTNGNWCVRWKCDYSDRRGSYCCNRKLANCAAFVVGQFCILPGAASSSVTSQRSRGLGSYAEQRPAGIRHHRSQSSTRRQPENWYNPFMVKHSA